MDGGISDNLAMRSMINAMVVLAADGTVLREMNISAVRRILLISADGESSDTGDGAKKAELSRIGQVLNAVTGTQIDRYDFETLILAKSQLQELRKSIRDLRCQSGPVIDGHACDDVEATFIHLSLAEISNATERDHLERIPTRLTLKDEDVDQLIEAGASVVRESLPLQQFRASMNVSNAFESAEHAGS
jgi:NTE family protein